MTPLMLGVSLALVAFDFQNLLSWWRGKLLAPGKQELFDFTIVVPLFGHPRYFAGREGIAQYRRNVLVALEVSPPQMDAFADELEAEGWRVCRIRLAGHPNPARLMAEALPAVTTRYALRLDADTRIAPGLARVVAAVADAGADLCSVKVEAEEPRSVPAKLQALEYRMAMLSRHYRPWLTSGACFIGRTDALRLIFAHHSLWTPGEDIETGRSAHALRLKIRHADFVVYTEVPETWRALFAQRQLWWAGTFRHTVMNADRNILHLPILTGYMLLVVYATIQFKWWGMIDWGLLPRELPLVLVVYVLVTFISNLQVRSRWMLVFPIYALAQSLVMPVLGVVRYAQLVRRNGSLGRFRFGYRRGMPAAFLEQERLARIERVASAVAAARRPATLGA
jgi:cellulose synthase/poly-beta-1,6-N-acetylglucosamine synthase-like glycosyltransferase